MPRELARDNLSPHNAAVIAAQSRTASCLTPRPSYKWRCAGSPEPGAEWRDAVAQLAELQNQYQAWLDSLPPSLAHSPTADALRAICDLDLTLLEIEPPRGYGRD